MEVGGDRLIPWSPILPEIFPLIMQHVCRGSEIAGPLGPLRHDFLRSGPDTSPLQQGMLSRLQVFGVTFPSDQPLGGISEWKRKSGAT